MPKILVNYRRDDSAAYAGRLADRLRERFGSDNVFVDIDTIRPGDDYVETIDQSIASCDAIVVIIGRSWLGVTDGQGRRRLDLDDDFVRTEIVRALQRRIRVIPVLVGGAMMPEVTDLPPDLAGLSRRQGIEISDTRFHQDADRLIETLADGGAVPLKASDRVSVGTAGTPFPSVATARSSRWIAGAVGALVIAGIAYWTMTQRGARPGTEPQADVESQPNNSARPANPPVSPPPSESSASGGIRPGAEVPPAPPLAPEPPGMTGIQVVWRGATSIPCALYDEAGTKPLSGGRKGPARCAPGAEVWDAAPGKYQIRFVRHDALVAPLPVTVSRGAVTRVVPPVGQLRFHWNGSNRVRWYVLDAAGLKTLSPGGALPWTCQPGTACVRDIGPGNYRLKVDAAGYEPVRFTIAAFRITNVPIP